MGSSTNILDLQALERKAQLLKRAIKIIEEEDDDTLETLAAGWRLKGREVANQLWTETVNNGWGGADYQDNVKQVWNLLIYAS
jgi:hypothetical protein